MAELFPADRLFVIAGPCVVESDELNLRVARELKRSSPRRSRAESFSRPASTRRTGRIAARRAVRESTRGSQRSSACARTTGLAGSSPTCICPISARTPPSVVDALQIPAFLCRQTDLLEAAGATGKAVNVKKGQWLHPEGMRGAVRKVRGGSTTSRTLARHRGDGARNVLRLRRSRRRHALVHANARSVLDAPVIFDATHSVQRPGHGPEGSERRSARVHPAFSRWPRLRQARRDFFSRLIPIPTMRRATGRTCCRSSELESADRVAPSTSGTRHQSMNHKEIVERGRRVVRMEREALSETERRIGDRFRARVECIARSTGARSCPESAKSGLIGRKIAATLTSTGTPATFLHPADSLHGDLGIVGESDVAILISKSGESNELVALLDHLKRLGVCTIAHRRAMLKSTLARHTDVTLDGVGEGRSLRARSRSNDEHDCRPRARRCARGRAARGEGIRGR